jgi:hypothetical protein
MNMGSGVFLIPCSFRVGTRGTAGIPGRKRPEAQSEYRNSKHGTNSKSKIDELVRSQKTPFFVIPVKTGIQSFQSLLDSRLRGSDGLEGFLP